MLNDRVEWRWIECFKRVFSLCNANADESIVILSETQSRTLNVHLSELALSSMGCRPMHITLPTPDNKSPVPVRSTGACQAINFHPAAMAALTQADFIVDCTVEGLLHARELPNILKSGARVQMVSNEHPEALERLMPDPALKPKVQQAARMLRETQQMTVQSKAGTDLRVDMTNAPAVGVWGYTSKPGTMAHWPGGIVVAFPQANSVNGTLVIDAGDMNLTFKRYLESPVTFHIENDYVVDIEGHGTDAELHRRYFSAWGDREAFATSHVGWGMNPAARYEGLACYDQRDTNCTEQRAYAGNFLYSTGANEFAGRYTEGHFDIPVRGCDIALDGQLVVSKGEIQAPLL